MKHDSHELDTIASAVPARMDMYAGIHKAMRACMTDTLLAVGRMDCSDPAELDATLQRVGGLLELCRAHLKHENEHVHVAIEARAPGASGAVAHDHEEHLAAIADIGRLVAQVRTAAAGRDFAAFQLYQRLALFVADNFQHMHVEETAHNAVLWARYTDAELVAIHDALVGSIPPQEMLGIARWLVPFMNPAERAGLLADIRGKAPAPAFQAILDTVQPHLSATEWAKLARALDLPPVPGLVAA